MNEKQYDRLVKELSPRSPAWCDCAWAFCVGGGICALGQFFINWYTSLGLPKADASGAASMTLVAIAALLTGFGVFDKIARHAGAGTLVPVTGFSNAVVSQALDAKSEGYVLGVGAKIYTVAGPVILFGLLSGAVYGVILYIYQTVTAML